MPHLTLEYTRNLIGLDPVVALQRLNEAMMASGLFNDADIKSSAIPIEQWQIGTGPAASITP
jgi:5-carboxymethyl-2-hydroxymuconate isomerase